MYTKEKMACDRIGWMFVPRDAFLHAHAAYFDARRRDANPIVPCASAARAGAWTLYPAGVPFPCDCALGAKPRPYALG